MTLMDWTIPLHRQQLDFIKRLQELRQSPGSPLLLNHGHPGVWSEQVTIGGDRLSQIRSHCRQRILSSDPTVSVNQLWEQYLLEELANTAVTLIWSKGLNPIEETPNHFYWREEGSTPQAWVPRVQVLAVSGPATSDLIRPEEVNGCDLLIWVAVEESLDDAYQDYHPIILGFLPSDRLPPQGSFTLDHLWYGGGLDGYIQLAQPQPPRSLDTWLLPLMGGSNYTYPVAIAADGKTLATTSYDGRLKLWRFQESQLQEVLGGRSWSTTPSNLNSEGQTLSTQDTDSIYRTCHAPNGQLLRSLPGLASGVTTILLDASGKWLICGGQEGTIAIWQVETGQKQQSFHAHDGAVRFLAISTPGNTFASTGTDRRLRVWQWQDNTASLIFSKVREGISSITLSPDGSQVGCGLQNGQVDVWDVASGNLCYHLNAHSGPVRSLAISEEGTSLASSSLERTLKLWKTDTGNLEGLRTGQTDPLISLLPYGDGSWIELNLFQGDPPNWTTCQ
ncbi:WD40 repeat domain-containing protein [Sodalinema gerasimenkoae]|uniref:WD40 repeat domain-containing protein n=1 Tax=Sodalinema gerasimenkoae TaxID=2862348 RepID=UPI0013588D06|nr:WD40 repeat domain-containing protein [Sodalinema gerasimenkoae]